MKVDKFIKDYSEINDKEKYLTGLIKRKYIPYEEKIVICENIIKNSCYINVNGKQKFHQNTPIQNFLFALALIENYTKIEMGDESNDKLKGYNLIQENGLIDVVMGIIPELNEMTILLDIMMNDEIENNRSLTSFLDTRIDSLSVMLKSFEDLLNSLPENDKNE